MHGVSLHDLKATPESNTDEMLLKSKKSLVSIVQDVFHVLICQVMTDVDFSPGFLLFSFSAIPIHCCNKEGSHVPYETWFINRFNVSDNEMLEEIRKCIHDWRKLKNE